MDSLANTFFSIYLAQRDEGFDVGHLLTALFILFMIGSAVINVVRQAKREKERQAQSKAGPQQRQTAAPTQQTGSGRSQTQPETARQRQPVREKAENPLDLFLQSIGLEPTQPGDGQQRATPTQKPDAPPPLPAQKPRKPTAAQRAEKRPPAGPSSGDTGMPADDTRQTEIHADRLAQQEAARSTQQRIDISEQMAQHRKRESEAAAAQSYTASDRQQAVSKQQRKAKIERASAEDALMRLRMKAGAEEHAELGRLPATGERYPCKLLGVADGETVRVELDGKPQTVRLIGIESPGPGEPFYRESIEALHRMLDERQIELEYERPGRREIDNQKRLLAYLFADGSLVNRQMTLNGWSWVSESQGRRRLRNDLTVAQGQARMRGIGVWRKGGESAREKLARLKSKSPIVQALVMSEVLKPPKALARRRRF